MTTRTEVVQAAKTLARIRERTARENEAKQARAEWLAALAEGDRVAWILRGGMRREAMVATVIRFTPTLIIVDHVGAKFRRSDGSRVGDRGVDLVKPDAPEVLAALLREAALKLAADVISEAEAYQRRKGHQDPLVLAHTLRDLAVAASTKIENLREQIDAQQEKRLIDG